MWIKVLGIATTCLLLGAIAIGWQGDVEAQDLHRKSNPKPADTAKPEQVVRAPLKKGERIQLEMLPSPLARIVARQEADRKRYGIGKLQDRDPSQRDKGVFNMAAIWGPEVVKLRVCFVSGVRSLRAGVAAVALEWTAAVPSLPKLDFGNPRDPRLCAANAVNEIRISFNEDEDSFSLSGSQSILNLDLPSMNFSGISTRTSSDPIFRTTVLHEFGHAFGLEHEHQHPDGTCDAEYDWPRILAYTSQPPNGWNEEQTRFQLERLDREKTISTAFDPNSVMIYEFPAEFFSNGPRSRCYQPRKHRISEGDKAMLREAYPSNRSDRIALLTRVIDHHRALIKKNDRLSTDVKKAGEDFIDALIVARPPDARPN